MAHSSTPHCTQAEEQAELAGTAAADKMAGVVQAPADAPTRVQEQWAHCVAPLLREHGKAVGVKPGECAGVLKGKPW